jgi:hypothetical protein
VSANENAQTHSRESGHLQVQLIRQADFFAAFTFAHRARCAAAILLRALADIVRFLGIVTTFPFPPFAFTLTQRALWAAAILALPAAEIPPRGSVPLPYAAPKAESAAPIALISLVNRSCSFFNSCTTLAICVNEPPLNCLRNWIVSTQSLEPALQFFNSRSPANWLKYTEKVDCAWKQKRRLKSGETMDGSMSAIGFNAN